VSGAEDSLPSVLKLGANFRVLGEEGWRQAGRHELSLNLDGDFTPLRPNLPSLYHLGVEWSPVEFLDVRAGIDQEIVGRGEVGLLEPTNNLTLGVGLYAGSFRFDYAFHQYSQLSDNDTHYFSIAYGVGKKKKVEIKGSPFAFVPKDKSVQYTEQVTIEGKILFPEIKRVAFNNLETAAAKDRFEVGTPIGMGKNYFVFDGYDQKWKLLGSQKYRILRLVTFKDLVPGYWAKLPIEKLATFGIISGFPDGTFQPESNITRAQMCKLLVATLPPTSDIFQLNFKDVPDKHWAAAFIARANALGMIRGYPNGTFNPNGNISRAEGVSILARFGKMPVSRLTEMPFADLPGRHWAIKEIGAAKEAGILKYLEGKPFEPDKELTRAEVAEMLFLTGPVAEKIRPLTEWEKD